MERLAEEWRAVVGWEGSYEVSSWGRVRSVNRVVMAKNGYARALSGRIRVFHRSPGGYPAVGFRAAGVGRTMLVHRLVAFAFIPNPNDYLEVNHLDGDKYNARVENLEWCTRIQNNDHAWATGLSKLNPTPPCGEVIHTSKLTADQIVSIRAERLAGASLKEIAKKYGVRNTNICAICLRQTWKHVI